MCFSLVPRARHSHSDVAVARVVKTTKRVKAPAHMVRGLYLTRNSSIIAVLDHNPNGSVACVVLASHTEKIGTKFTYKNDMGHVMCKGEETSGKKCILHHLDASRLIERGTSSHRYILMFAADAKAGKLVLPKAK